MDTITPLDAAGLRRFALQTAAALAVVFGVALPLIFDYRLPVWPWIAGASLAALGMLAPRVLDRPYRWWMRMAMLIGAVNSSILLTLVFLIIFVPTALVMRLARRDPLRRTFDDDVDSYRVSSRAPPVDHLKKPF